GPGWAVGNAAYVGTPLVGGKACYSSTPPASRPNFTLANLNANFPYGCKVIVYVSGFLTATNSFITDGTTTFYYRAATNATEITNSLAAGWYQTTQTTDLGNANNPLAQYAVFGEAEPLTNDVITFTLGTTVGTGSWIAGFQIVGTSASEPPPRLLTSEGFSASGYAPGVSLINNATLGFGYDGPWTGFGGQVRVLSNSLVYPGYGNDGAHRVQLTNNSAIRRQFLTGNNGPLGNYLDTNGLISISRNGTPLYLAFLVAAPTNEAPGGNLSLYNGDYSLTNRFFMVQLQTTNPFPLTATVPSGATPQTLGNNNNAANLVVARFDFAGTNGAVRLWLNPSTAGAEPPPQAVFTNVTIAFDRLQLTHGFASFAVDFDEIRFGSDWAATVRSNGLATLPGIQTLVGMRGLPPSPLGGTNYPREFFPFVDAFGQYRHLEWTNKVRSVAELQQSATNELADLAANPGPAQWCEYGGWANGPQLAATGVFRVQKYLGNWWFVCPHGHLFWSHGVTGVNAPGVPTAVTFRQNYFASLPLPGDADEAYFTPAAGPVASGYYTGLQPLTMDFMAANALRKYGPNWPDYTRDLLHTRLRSWGLNTIGSWTTTNTYLLRRTPYARVLFPFVGGINGDARMPDYFNPSFATALTNALSGPERNDPWCLGFYVHNELEWTRPGMFPDTREVGLTTLAATNTSFAKAAFRDQLTAKYGTIGALNAQWGTSYSSWTDFLNQRTTFPSGASGDVDLNAFYRNYAEQFFRVSGEVIRAYTSNLFLGSRFAGQPHVAAAQACTNFVDVASFNSYNNTVGVLTGLEADIPLLNTEHNFCATDSGLFWEGLNLVSNQAQRATRYTTHFNSAVNSARFVGKHWFQLLDRSTTGILNSDADGNNNNGLVDVTDTPYAPLIGAIRNAGQVMYAQRLGTTPPTITAITNRTINLNTSTGPIAFTIGDDLTPVGSLALSKECSNTNLVPLAGIVFGGSGSNRTVTVTPATGQSGTATITVVVTDAQGARGFASFELTVLPAPNPPVFGGPSVSNQLFKVTISGDAGADYYIQASTNLLNWQTVFTNLNATPPFVWEDPQTTNFSRRFYRVLLEP
ncbi:MAG: beta-galactosidase, partial [Limisphaerales bacterium]